MHSTENRRNHAVAYEERWPALSAHPARRTTLYRKPPNTEQNFANGKGRDRKWPWLSACLACCAGHLRRSEQLSEAKPSTCLVTHQQNLRPISKSNSCPACHGIIEVSGR